MNRFLNLFLWIIIVFLIYYIYILTKTPKEKKTQSLDKPIKDNMYQYTKIYPNSFNTTNMFQIN